MFNRREDALERFIEHFESKGPEAEAEAADPTAGMEPEEALHWHILRRKKEGVEDQIDASVEKIGAVPTLNDVLLPAMKEVGDKFGAGELILPFVLQSRRGHEARGRPARAVPRPARGLHEGHRRAGDRVRRRARHRQVARQHDPDQQRLHGRRPRQAGADPDDPRRGQGARGDRDRPLRAAGLHVQADAAGHPGAAPAGPRVPGADRRRRDQPQLRAARPLPGRQGSDDTQYDPGVFYCKDAFEGLVGDGPHRRARDSARRWSTRSARPRPAPARRSARTKRSSTRRRHRPLRRPHRRPGPRAPVLGRARDPGRPRRALHAPRHPRAVQAPLGRRAA